MKLRPSVIALVLAVTSLLAAACGGSAHALLNTASRDLACPRNYLSVVGLVQNVRGVYGCGRRGTYVRNCAGGRCDWVLDMRYMTYWQ